jgi:hypothetical protein
MNGTSALPTGEMNANPDQMAMHAKKTSMAAFAFAGNVKRDCLFRYLGFMVPR